MMDVYIYTYIYRYYVYPRNSMQGVNVYIYTVFLTPVYMHFVKKTCIDSYRLNM